MGNSASSDYGLDIKNGQVTLSADGKTINFPLTPGGSYKLGSANLVVKDKVITIKAGEFEIDCSGSNPICKHKGKAVSVSDFQKALTSK